MRTFRALLLVMMLLWTMPAAVFGYSYGDPNQDEVAEDFKQIVVKLNASPADWAAVSEIYKVRRAEIVSHFGEQTAAVLDANLQAKDKDNFIDNYKGLLVKNLERRFTYALDGIKDYSQAKLLLAKAKGTFDALQPYVQAKKPDETAKINAAFDRALNALGNPGLFGVGEKPADPAELKKQTDYILGTLAAMFPFDGKAAGGQAAKPAEPKPAEGAAHAPMERTGKTNPVISIVVIAGVILALGGAVWYAKRKGII